MNAIRFTSLSGKWKSLLVTDKAIILSNKEYNSKDAMMQNLKGQNALEEKEEFWYQSLDELSYLSNGTRLTLKKVNFKGNEVSTKINMDSIEFINSITEAMSQEHQYTTTEENLSMMRALRDPIFGTLVVSALAIGSYFLALDMANGGTVNTSGRRG